MKFCVRVIQVIWSIVFILLELSLEEILDYFRRVRALKFEEQPDYSALKDIFRSMLSKYKEKQHPKGLQFDWVKNYNDLFSHNMCLAKQWIKNEVYTDKRNTQLK